MTTKDEFLLPSGKQKSVSSDISIDSGGQYSNLNFNKSYKAPVIIPAQIFSKPYKSEYCGGKRIAAVFQKLKIG